jgi:hypothetical protein
VTYPDASIEMNQVLGIIRHGQFKNNGLNTERQESYVFSPILLAHDPYDSTHFFPFVLSIVLGRNFNTYTTRYLHSHLLCDNDFKYFVGSSPVPFGTFPK